jgi:hypothetical protein
MGLSYIEFINQCKRFLLRIDRPVLQEARGATPRAYSPSIKFALKCSAIDRNGKWHNVRKNPKQDPSKASKGGRFNLSCKTAKILPRLKWSKVIPFPRTTLSKPSSRTVNYSVTRPLPRDCLFL